MCTRAGSLGNGKRINRIASPSIWTAAVVVVCASSIGEDIPIPVFDHPPVFDYRFSFSLPPVLVLEKSALHAFIRPISMEPDGLQRAKNLLAQKLIDSRAEISSFAERKQEIVGSAIPLPRARPARANLDPERTAFNQGENQNLLQKLVGLFGGQIKLASLTPDAGLDDAPPDFQSLGFDDHTAVYDISARTVYMPTGSKLEAHSGFGDRKDDPQRVSERNVGSTPPAVYELKLREQLFHGVQALRLIPVDGQTTLGRNGLLTHNYLLGPDGDSNGCVSIKEYDKFLAAFQNGEVKRLVVVTGLTGAAQLAAIRS